ncbi:MAG: PAS domain-containing protein, partial [Bacteroidales bacterium]|nr:PAS domain-containing protein [Bacteroidales bacterium]
PVIFREEYILYPICLKRINQETWDEMLLQSNDIGYAFIQEPDATIAHTENSAQDSLINGTFINLDTGSLTPAQINDLFNHLPVDITLVNENDEVIYFSNPPVRHFPRSKAIIGRKVQNCHPPESIDVVNKIIESFKSGKKDFERFWIQMKGKLILIQYFAIRDVMGVYKGVAEVSQDITEIRDLKGEKRLLE